MRPLELIGSCLDLTDQDIADALAPARSLSEPGPRERSWALIEHLTRIAKPGRGGPKILLVLAHVSLRDWLDGELVVRLVGDPQSTLLELFVDEGVNRSRVLGPLRMEVPFGELATAVRLQPQQVLPLAVRGGIGEGRMELATSPELRRSSAPPSYSAVSASLLPLVSGGQRPLPNIASRPPPEDDEPKK